jgi:hypothetical protein
MTINLVWEPLIYGSLVVSFAIVWLDLWRFSLEIDDFGLIVIAGNSMGVEGREEWSSKKFCKKFKIRVIIKM